MRSLRAILAPALAAASFAAAAQPYRDDLPVPSYRLLASMLTQLRDGTPLERANRPVEVIAPLVHALGRKYGVDVEGTLRRAVAAGDRDAAFAATTLVVLLDAQDLVEEIHRDDYTGWADAKVRTKKAFLDYGLVAEDVRRRQAELDRRLVMDFARLALALHNSDMTTPPEAIDGPRDAVAADLVAARAVAKVRSGRSGAGGGS